MENIPKPKTKILINIWLIDSINCLVPIVVY